ncbi:AcrR family transcriptional regulator [Arthrobacter ulcerisalmonis]|uniref:TetR/AcrR family transcriptional regulator n=1 Tax=Arthrobacter sp. B1I2 TaxID=3042263 RepID=UPI0027898579|nr:MULTISPECIES: TetR/AcrR family transcriptional regulator [Arthrobacter]MDQ0662230.1 AcrR family transcriptional regulator [Arthrobacter ulcerisalmonis]MDQ0730160.1 AcrR family transcriptional regulator [Arthrobacter sp. B1I2]
MGRPLRADAERTVRAIVEAAEQVLSRDPGASMEQIGDAAGVARTTVHRRFTSRQALIDALAISAKQQLAEAVEESRPDTSPPLVALYRVTANVLKTKNAWKYTLGSHAEDTSAAADIWDQINARTLDLMSRAQREGLLDPSADLQWTRQVYYALMSEALQRPPGPDGVDTDTLAELVVDTLLYGAGKRTA